MLVPCVTWGLSNVTNWRDTVSLTQVRHPLSEAISVLPLTSVMLHALHIIDYMAASNSSFLSLWWQVLMFHASAGSFINIYITLVASVLCGWNDMMIEPKGQHHSLVFSCLFSLLKLSILTPIIHRMHLRCICFPQLRRSWCSSIHVAQHIAYGAGSHVQSENKTSSKFSKYNDSNLLLRISFNCAERTWTSKIYMDEIT